MSTHGGTKAIIAALLANLGIAVTKFIAFLLTRSASMLAESVHSVADASNQLLLLLAGRRARKAPDEVHPFGYGRYRYFYAFVVAIVLFSLGGLFALYEAWHKFADPHPIEGQWAWVPVVVLLAAIVMEGFSLRTAVRESNLVRGDRGWVEFVRTSRAPELPVVLLEDIGALLGLVFALFGVGMTLYTHNGQWDAIGSAAIGVLLVVIAIVLARETTSMILGEAATPEDVAAVRGALVGGSVASVIHLRTMHLGPEEILVAAKIEVPGAATAAEVSTAIDDAEQRVRAAVPYASLIYLEPDLRHAADTAPAAPTATEQPGSHD